jgi:hypothetical protein
MVPQGGPPPGKRKSGITLEAYLAECKMAGVDAIPEGDPVFDYAEAIGLPLDFLRLCWLEFAAKHRETSKRQASWPQKFRNCVRENWFRLWWKGPSGWELTTAGKQAHLAHGFRSAA